MSAPTTERLVATPHVLSKRERGQAQRELTSILDQDDANSGTILSSKRYIVSAAFISRWLLFAHHMSGPRPSGCDNTSLLSWDKSSNLFSGKPGLQYETHFRHVNRDTWFTFLQFYPDSGPTLTADYKDIRDPSKWFVVNQRAAAAKLRSKRSESKRVLRLQRKQARLGSVFGALVAALIPSARKNAPTRLPEPAFPTLQAYTCDHDSMMFENDTSALMDLVVMLEREEPDACIPGSKQYVVATSWIKRFVAYVCGVTPEFPGALDNVVLLEQHETLMGPSWTMSQQVLSDPTLFVVRSQICYDVLLQFLPASGPPITINSKATGIGAADSSAPKLAWIVDERWLLRRIMGMELGSSNVDAEVNNEQRAQSAVLNMFVNPIAEKAMAAKVEEDRQLEEQQKVQETEIVAAVLSKGAENRRKSVADDLQKEVNDMLLLETMLIMNRSHAPSISFIATQEEKEDCYARTLQHFMQVSCVKLRRDRKKKEAEKAYEHWAATKLQNVWRRKKAVNKIKKIKSERLRVKKEISALKVENTWRAFLAKRTMKEKKNDKKLAEDMQKGATVITNAWRGRTARSEYLQKKKACGLLSKIGRKYLDKKKANKMRRNLEYIPFRVTIVNVTGLKFGGVGSDAENDASRPTDASGRSPTVTVAPRQSAFGGSLFSRPSVSLSPGAAGAGAGGGGDNKINPRVYISGFGAKTMTACCLTKTAGRVKTSSPVYDETVTLCGPGLDGDGTVVFTVLNHNKFGNHGFLGQAVVDLRSALPDDYFAVTGSAAEDGHRAILMEGVELKKYKFPLPDYSGVGVQKIDGTESFGAGQITLEFTPLLPASSLCGWLSVSTRVSKTVAIMGFLGSPPKGDEDGDGGADKWEMKYCVLAGGTLTMHTSPYRLNEVLVSVTKDSVESFQVVEKEEPFELRRRAASRLGLDDSFGAPVAIKTRKEMRISLKGKKEYVKMKMPSSNLSGGVEFRPGAEAQWAYKLQRAFDTTAKQA